MKANLKTELLFSGRCRFLLIYENLRRQKLLKNYCKTLIYWNIFIYFYPTVLVCSGENFGSAWNYHNFRKKYRRKWVIFLQNENLIYERNSFALYSAFFYWRFDYRINFMVRLSDSYQWIEKLDKKTFISHFSGF